MTDHMTAEQLRAELSALNEFLGVVSGYAKIDDERVRLARGKLTALSARLSGMAAVPQWQPIKTAPKGKRVLVSYVNKLGKRRAAMATYFTADDISDWENGDSCDPGWYERSYAHEAESELVFATEAEPDFWMNRPASPEPPHV